MPVSSPKKTRRACKGLYEHIAEALRPLAVPIADLTQDPANARLHPPKNVEGIAASLRVYGQRKPVVVNKRTGTIEAGNGTLEAARTLGWGHIAAVYVDDDAATAAGFSISDNRTAELATWDTVALDKLLREVSTGNDPQLDAMLEELRAENPVAEPLPEPGAGGDDFDATPETGPTRTNIGELWVIGGVHRLLVGDCTVAENVARLMGGEKAGLMVTDPPYGVDYASLVDSRENQKKDGWQDIQNDALSDDELLSLLTASLNGAGALTAFVWHPPGARRKLFWSALESNGWRVAQEIVWVKNALVFGRADYQWRHEPCIYAKRDGAPRQGDRTQTTVWEENKPTDSQHPTQKPLALFERPIRNHGENGDIVYDPFLGSGTTLIAAHRLNRRCYGCEIEPRYADVILKRAEAEGLTVEKAP